MGALALGGFVLLDIPGPAYLSNRGGFPHMIADTRYTTAEITMTQVAALPIPSYRFCHPFANRNIHATTADSTFTPLPFRQRNPARSALRLLDGMTLLYVPEGGFMRGAMPEVSDLMTTSSREARSIWTHTGSIKPK